MKKLLFMLSFVIASTTVNAKVSCDDADGIQRTGRSGNVEYCQSSQTMNWWSANAWCDAVGGTLFDIADCSLATFGAYCPQINQIGLSSYFWTSSVNKNGQAAVMHSGTDRFLWTNKNSLNSAYALCRLK